MKKVIFVISLIVLFWLAFTCYQNMKPIYLINLFNATLTPLIATQTDVMQEPVKELTTDLTPSPTRHLPITPINLTGIQTYKLAYDGRTLIIDFDKWAFLENKSQHLLFLSYKTIDNCIIKEMESMENISENEKVGEIKFENFTYSIYEIGWKDMTHQAIKPSKDIRLKLDEYYPRFFTLLPLRSDENFYTCENAIRGLISTLR
jgi:hypothetical protein